MVPLITQLISTGYTAAQILKFLSNKIPQLSKNISGAQSQGYPAEQILKYLSTKIQPSNDRAYKQGLNSNERYLAGSGIKTPGERTESRNKFIKGALGVGAGVLGAYGTLKAAQNYLNVAPTTGYGTPPQTPPTSPPAQASALPGPQQPQAITNTPSPMPPIGPRGGLGVPQPVNVAKGPGLPPQNQLKAIAPPANVPSEPVTMAPEKPDSGAILDKLGLRLRIEKMRHQGHEPNMIIQAAEKLVPKEMQGQFPVKEIVADYLSKSPTTALKKLPEEQGRNFKGLLEPFEDKPIRPEDYQRKPEDVKPLDKGALVLTPNGKVSEVKAKAPTGLIVDDGGKGVKHQEADLEQEPADIPNIVENILKIPEVNRSSIVSLFTFDPDDNSMYIQYHNGETYKYNDVDPKEVAAVADKMGIPVTEGKGMYGAWSPEDKKSLGAALIQRFLQNPKYKKPKKGEPANPNYKKLETFYDYWEKLRKKPKRKS